MITYIVGDLFQSPAQVLVNAVNTVGVMGKGIAADFKRIYPDMFKRYQYYCENQMFDIGQLLLHKTSHKWVLNFPTKKHWRSKSKPDYIELGLDKFVNTYDSKGITSISFPMLGCGNGELDWETQVRPIMEAYLKNLPIDVYIHLFEKYDPFSPEHRNIQEIEAWLRGEPQSLAFTEFWHDLTSVIVKQPTLKTLQGEQNFSVHYDIKTQTIEIEQTQMHVKFGRDSFINLWQFIRSAGFCMGKDLPLDFVEYTAQIITLLSQLDYLRPVLMSDALHYNKHQIGLQLVPSVNVFPTTQLIKPA